MKNYKPQIKPEKKNPAVTPGIMIAAWCIFFIVTAYDIYRFCFAPAPGADRAAVGVSDVFCGAGVAVVAVWFTVKFIKQRRNKK